MGESLIVRKGGSSGSVEEYFTPTGTEKKTRLVTTSQFSWTTSWKTLISIPYYNSSTHKTKQLKRAFAILGNSADGDTFVSVTKLNEEKSFISGIITYYVKLVDSGSELNLQVKRSKAGSVTAYGELVMIYKES